MVLNADLPVRQAFHALHEQVRSLAVCTVQHLASRCLCLSTAASRISIECLLAPCLLVPAVQSACMQCLYELSEGTAHTNWLGGAQRH